MVFRYDRIIKDNRSKLHVPKTPEDKTLPFPLLQAPLSSVLVSEPPSGQHTVRADHISRRRLGDFHAFLSLTGDVLDKKIVLDHHKILEVEDLIFLYFNMLSFKMHQDTTCTVI
ncbi:hypothetical protein FQA47_025190 [Oryzias melastigma]|uniref:Uncharacterized protein n=1 Tax=Oryzias melastigma TaxID=30732 RepID=A0A834FE49_ORYME|nr:hypothetical protein FQA47_025190 [Oryzias melastigma]